MDNLLSLFEIDSWRKMLGLLPVPLFGSNKEQRFILLNGNQGNFCLDISGDESIDGTKARNYAWSSNVNHYVNITKNGVELQRWDRQSYALERYSIRSITSNLAGFHQYLEKSNAKSDKSIIAHSIKIFRRLRAVLGSNFNGEEGLNAFLYFLSCAAEAKPREEIDKTQWHLSERSEEVANQIREEDWSALQSEYISGRQLEGLVPDVSLVLRHASGQLFQEAHYDAILTNPNQLMLAGFLPEPVKIASSRTNIVGLHFTPPALARTLVEETLRLINLQKETITIFDPACGSGEFLREAIRQLGIHGYTGRVHVIGWDISDIACAMARYELGWEIQSVPFSVTMTIDCKDSISITEEWPREVDIVLMNPPFLSFEDMVEQQKKVVKEILGPVTGSRPDLSHAFLLQAIKSLSNSGAIGTIIPVSVLDGISSQKIRVVLAEELQTSIVAKLGSHQLFPGAIVDPAFYVGGKTKNEQIPLAFWADQRASSNSQGLRTLRRIRYYSSPQSLPIVENGFSIYPYPNQDDEVWSPKPYESWQLMKSLTGMTTVDDLFDIRQGIRTGHKKVYILDDEQFSELPDLEKEYFRPAVVNESIKFGYLRRIAYAFFPHGKQNEFNNENELVERLPFYSQTYLLPNKSVLQKRARIDSTKWWELQWHRTWLEERKSKLLSTSYGDSGSFAWDKEGDFVVVQGNAWICRKGEMTEKQNLAYLAILNSTFFSKLIAANSRHVGGGQWDLSKQYIKIIPLPNIFDSSFNINVLDNLYNLGKGIHENILPDQNDLEEIVRQAYSRL
jgi:hypothetical protein